MEKQLRLLHNVQCRRLCCGDIVKSRLPSQFFLGIVSPSQSCWAPGRGLWAHLLSSLLAGGRPLGDSGLLSLLKPQMTVTMLQRYPNLRSEYKVLNLVSIIELINWSLGEPTPSLGGGCFELDL